MRIRFLAPARSEFVDAISYYNSQSKGLGDEFTAEVERTIGRIIQYPNAWTSLSEGTRRCRTNRFPYGVIYQVSEDLIIIVAIMHMRKKPDSWKSRLAPD